MKPIALAFAVLALALAATDPARAADPERARAFLIQLYAHYPQANADFDPTGANARAVFDPSMVALFRQDARLTPKGYVGAIDSDPICDCQDDGGLRSRIGAVRLVAPDTATAQVELTFAAASPPEVRRLSITLVTVHGQWRLYDIRSQDTPSFRAYLVKANADARRGR